MRGKMSVSGDVSVFLCNFFFQAEDGIRDLVRSRGLGDVYKRQIAAEPAPAVYVAGLSPRRMATIDRAALSYADPILSLIHI